MVYRIKKLCSAALAAFILGGALCVPARAEYAVGAKCAILYEPVTGTVLYEKNADETRLIASTTKIMTALITLEKSALDEEVIIPRECESVEGSSMYLRAGDRYSVRELLYGLLLQSGNDAAVALAVHVAGSVEDFAALMNERAAGLGCENTHFVNPHGLDAKEHYSTARDLAFIAAEAMKNEVFRGLVSTRTVSIGGKTYTNHNKLLTTCEGVVGLKTGYTKSAGRTLVTAAERDGMRLICVTLADPDDWNDHAALYDEAFREWRLVATPVRGAVVARVPVISGEKDTVAVTPAERTAFLARREAAYTVTLEVPRFAYAAVKAGDKAGRLILKCDGEAMFTADLVYAESVEQDKGQQLRLLERLGGG